MNSDPNISAFSLIADFDGNIEDVFNIATQSGSIEVIPLRNTVIFPGVVLPIAIEREFSQSVVKRALEKSTLIGVVYQRDPKTEDPKSNDLYDIGNFVRVMRIIEMPGGRITALLQGFCRFRVNSIIRRKGLYRAEVTPMHEKSFKEDDKEFIATIDILRQRAVQIYNLTANPEENTFAINNIQNPVFLLNFVCSNINFNLSSKIDLLRLDDPTQRATRMLSILQQEIELATLRAKIQSKTREDLEQQQRDWFLQQEIRNIQEELGEDSTSEIEELKKKLSELQMPPKTRLAIEKELTKIEHIHQQSPDYSVQYNYLQTVLSMPWGKYSDDNIDILKAERTLNRDHYGLEKVKERILEHLAVVKKRGDFKAPIICLYGPPGIGKTSLGHSIASAMGRQYVRVSLGGVHDEAEIRGHRRTYIGAMPGRIVKNLIKCGTANPVFVLDEIDKVAQQTNNGDPTSALLEVLDPEQNNSFHDNFVDLDFDLSKVMFIATANNIGLIPAPLRDRMEMIEMSGYITEEKIEIARRHLIPKAKEENGLADEKALKFSKPALEKIVEQYTRESGVRTLEKRINEILRKIDYQLMRDGEIKTTTIKPQDIEPFLGKPAFSRDIYQGNQYAGVVTGLAWTSVGGEILFIETSLSRGKGGKLSLTGNLGDVMKESATIALEYIKSHAPELGIDYRIFDNYNIHIHVPEGATPKDGPSAGITIATSLASALTQRKVRSKIAMTGEITLRGKVLPVGGIKEKILAAKRAGITTILICRDNRKDIEEIPEVYLKDVEFHYVENVGDVLKEALLKEKVPNPIVFDLEEKSLT